MKSLATVLLAFALCGCETMMTKKVEHLATARIATDFDNYSIHRVGLLPFLGRGLDEEHIEILQKSFFTELSLQTPFEVVPLERADLEEVHLVESYVRGRYDSVMVIDLARRFRFDGMLIGTVVDYQFFSPQRLSVQMDLVATETGAAIWSSSVQLDASSPRVREALEAFYRSNDAVEAEDGEGWEIALLSPRLFAQFAAWQITRML